MADRLEGKHAPAQGRRGQGANVTQADSLCLEFGKFGLGSSEFMGRNDRESNGSHKHRHVKQGKAGSGKPGLTDAFARGLKIAAAIRADGRLAELVKNRYASWDNGIGAAIEADKEDFNSLEKYALSKPDPMQYDSGRQELLESIVNEFI
jgi:xylose isomerase